MPTEGPAPWDRKIFYDEHDDDVDEVSPIVTAAVTIAKIPLVAINTAVTSGRKIMDHINHRNGE